MRGIFILKNLFEVHQALLDDQSEHIVLVLIDGLGYYNLEAYQQEMPFLASHWAEIQPVQTTLPSTTAVAIPSFLLGQPAKQTGFWGYSLNYQQKRVQALNVPGEVGLPFINPVHNLFSQKNLQGYYSYSFGMSKFAKTAFNQILTAGSQFIGHSRSKYPLIAYQEAQAAGVIAGPSLTYVYVGDLDQSAHHNGVGSEKFLTELRKFDQVLEEIVGIKNASVSATSSISTSVTTHAGVRLPAGVANAHNTTYYIIADHGSVNVDLTHQVDIQNYPKLVDAIALMTGEPRLPYLYGNPEQLLSLSQKYLSDDFEILTRDQFISLTDNDSSDTNLENTSAAGDSSDQNDPEISKVRDSSLAKNSPRLSIANGPTANGYQPTANLVGDVVLIPRSTATLVDSKTMLDNAMTLKAVHGANSRTERIVPFLKLSTNC
ncbi:MAG: alkaline phosphatase family protein [Bifidobacteriaceae bacterium]|nr:alkaline phosphatase family protein [Bifidobacteriaceae bacterium]